MPAPEQWEHASLVQVEKWRDAQDHEEGLPRRGAAVTGGIHGPIPDTWTEGAPGWSGHVSSIDTRRSTPPRYAIGRTTAAQRHEGKPVDHPVHGRVNLPAAVDAVARTPDWDSRSKSGRLGGGR